MKIRSISLFLLISLFGSLCAAVPSDSATNAISSTQNAEDQFRLGRAYYRGEGVPQSYEQAGLWYRKSADQGNTKAMHNLGIMFLEGQGTMKDEAEGYRWIRKAAEKGDPKATYLCGTLLCKGRGVTRNCSEGFVWLEKSASQGNSSALARLGQDYLFGDEQQTKDINKAVPLIQRAALSGDPWACGALGQLYIRGEGVPLDRKAGARWLEEGAHRGDPAAMVQYGHLLMEQSLQAAYPWFKLAIMRNAPMGQIGNALQECIQGLSPTELADGNKQAQMLNQQLPPMEANPPKK